MYFSYAHHTLWENSIKFTIFSPIVCPKMKPGSSNNPYCAKFWKKSYWIFCWFYCCPNMRAVKKALTPKMVSDQTARCQHTSTSWWWRNYDNERIITRLMVLLHCSILQIAHCWNICLSFFLELEWYIEDIQDKTSFNHEPVLSKLLYQLQKSELWLHIVHCALYTSFDLAKEI